MLHKAVFTAVCLTALSSSVMAQGITGGELTIDAYSYSEGDDPNGTNYSGAIEYAINRNFSVAGAISIYDYSLLDSSVKNYTIHGIYHVNDDISVGGFIGNESYEGSDATFFGIEGGYETGDFEVEGYAAFYSNDDDSSVVGLSGEYQINETFSALANVGFADVDSESFTRVSAGAEYNFAAGPSIYAEVGNIDGGGFDSVFLGLGASIEFGAERGTTFDRRGVFETINPGF